MKQVAIISSRPKSWYNNLVGHFFKVTEHSKTAYYYKTKDGWLFIMKENTVEI